MGRMNIYSVYDKVAVDENRVPFEEVSHDLPRRRDIERLRDLSRCVHEEFLQNLHARNTASRICFCNHREFAIMRTGCT